MHLSWIRRDMQIKLLRCEASVLRLPLTNTPSHLPKLKQTYNQQSQHISKYEIEDAL